MTVYKNSFYNPARHTSNGYIKAEFTTTTEPVAHKDFLIFKYSGLEYHIVKDATCVGMVGSLEAAIKRIDTNEPKLNTA